MAKELSRIVYGLAVMLSILVWAWIVAESTVLQIALGVVVATGVIILIAWRIGRMLDA